MYMMVCSSPWLFQKSKPCQNCDKKTGVFGNRLINGPVVKVAVTESSTPGQGRMRVFLSSSAGTSPCAGTLLRVSSNEAFFLFF